MNDMFDGEVERRLEDKVKSSKTEFERLLNVNSLLSHRMHNVLAELEINSKLSNDHEGQLRGFADMGHAK